MSVATVKNRRETLAQGADILASVLMPYGFKFNMVASGSSSGGAFAQGEFVRDDRKLELHYRYSLGLVTYHIGVISLAHADYMRVLIGRPGASHYPNFSDDPRAMFEALRDDLVEHCVDFLNGSGEQFRQCFQRQKEYEALPGFQKMGSEAA